MLAEIPAASAASTTLIAAEAFLCRKSTAVLNFALGNTKVAVLSRITIE